MSFPTRRTFLQTAVASFFLPKRLRAGEHSRSFWFLHTPTRETWAVDDPVTWGWQMHSSRSWSEPRRACGN